MVSLGGGGPEPLHLQRDTVGQFRLALLLLEANTVVLIPAHSVGEQRENDRHGKEKTEQKLKREGNQSTLAPVQ
jgi:hypothetical protein